MRETIRRKNVAGLIHPLSQDGECVSELQEKNHLNQYFSSILR